MPKSTTPKSEDPLAWAMYYHRIGWRIIATRHETKRPARRWKTYQWRKPTDDQIRKWFQDGKYTPAVVLGRASGNNGHALLCRDFDDPRSYDAWQTEQPKLARTLPTSSTPNGRHVFCLSSWSGFRHCGDGELRGTRGQYVLLPPGPGRQWLVSIKGSGLPIIDDPCKAGLGIPPPKPPLSHLSILCSPLRSSITQGSHPSIPEIIKTTLPGGKRQRHDAVFYFARRLKGLPQFASIDPRMLKALVRAWHRKALPYIQTKDFETTYIDFLKGWPRIRQPGNISFLDDVLKRATAHPVAGYENPKIGLLAAVCRELQKEQGREPFYLSTYVGARLLNTTPMSISRGLYLLRMEGVIELVQAGSIRTRRASRYHYTKET